MPIAVAANDNYHADRGEAPQRPTKTRSPIEYEHTEGRIPFELMTVADEVERLHTIATRSPGGTENPRIVGQSRLIGAEITADGSMRLAAMKREAGHLWPAVDAGVLKQRTMGEIGREFGASNDNAAAIGREKLKDGLRFAGRALARLEADDEAAGIRRRG